MIGGVVAATIMFGLRLTVPADRYSSLAGEHAEHQKKPGAFSDLRRDLFSLAEQQSQHKQNMSHMNMQVISERQFITDMIPHHQEAVDTTTKLLRTTQNPALQKLGAEIIAAQTQEIAMMQ